MDRGEALLEMLALQIDGSMRAAGAVVSAMLSSGDPFTIESGSALLRPLYQHIADVAYTASTNIPGDPAGMLAVACGLAEHPRQVALFVPALYVTEEGVAPLTARIRLGKEEEKEMEPYDIA